MKARITTSNFIKFLGLFNALHEVEALQFGDTGYKREGFIDQGILNGVDTIEAILNLNYNFDGLISFEGKIEDYRIRLESRMDMKLEFEIEANQNSLRNLEYKVIEQNAYDKGLFEFVNLQKYDK